jgi:hypothetical protein
MVPALPVNHDDRYHAHNQAGALQRRSFTVSDPRAIEKVPLQDRHR